MNKKNEAAAYEAEELEVMEATAAEEIDPAEDDQEEQEISLVLKLRKPYVFGGKEYTEVDLSALEDATAKDLEAVGRILEKTTKGKGVNPATMEMTMGYAQLLANRVTGLAVEFFKGLPAKDAMALKTTIVGFLYGGDGED
ncbi:MAG: phage tail assembly protein [Oscillibacter sp.]